MAYYGEIIINNLKKYSYLKKNFIMKGTAITVNLDDFLQL